MRPGNHALSHIIMDRRIHVYCLVLSRQNLFSLSRLEPFLSSEELTRADKFHFRVDRDRFVAVHSFLRSLLGSYLDCDPATLKCLSNFYGKPFLMVKNVSDLIYFNMSDSGDRVIYAFNRAGEIGIDIEKIRSDFATQEVAEQFFSDHEASVLRSLPEKEKVEGFYNCWTRKEAFIKAIGEGLSYPLKDFDVTLAPGEPAKVLRIKGDAREASEWTLQEIPIAADYKAAIAIRAKGLEVKVTAIGDVSQRDTPRAIRRK